MLIPREKRVLGTPTGKEPSHNSRKKVAYILIGLFINLTIIVLVGKAVGNFFELSNVYLEGYEGEKRKVIANFFENKGPLNTLFINSPEIATEIRKIDRSIKTVSIRKKLPSSIVIFITHQKQFARVIINPEKITAIESLLGQIAEVNATVSASPSGIKFEKKELIIDEDGEILEVKTSGNSPPVVLIIEQPESSGEIIKPTVIKDIAILVNNLANTNFNTGELVILKDKTYVLSQNEDPIFIFNGRRDLAEQVHSLQLMLDRFTIDGVKPKKIDLRFNKPVVVF